MFTLGLVDVFFFMVIPTFETGLRKEGSASHPSEKKPNPKIKQRTPSGIQRMAFVFRECRIRERILCMHVLNTDKPAIDQCFGTE